MPVFVSRRDRVRTALLVIAVAALLVGAFLALREYAPFLTTAAGIRSFVLGFGPWAPAAFVLLQATQVVAAPIPGQVTAVIGGFLFGPLRGTLYSVVGETLGSAVAFWLARRFGRRYVERVVTAETLDRFDAAVDDHGLRVLFLAFLLPGIPDDVLCFAGGLTDIRLRRLVLVSVVGRAPGLFLATLVGAQVADAQLAEAALLALVLIGVSAVGWLSRDWILERLG